MNEESAVQVRVSGPATLPVLVYLPGLHGDWTLIGRFKRAVDGRVRFVEITYPRSLTWSLADYAAGIEQALAEHGLERGWLLGESFGSQLVWPLVARRRFQVDAVVLAGGFVRHPAVRLVRMAERVGGRLPLSWIIGVLFSYARVARWRYRQDPVVVGALNEFIARRTELDRRAAIHRLHLLAGNDPRSAVRQSAVPVYGLTGVFDPVVPWIPVRRWLRKHCPGLRAYRLLPADHNVLSTAAAATADQVVEWMYEDAPAA